MIEKAYNVGIYCRLSNDDERDGESVSIENQKLLLQRYVRERGWNEVDTYVDDSYSGTNFQRPGVQRLIADAKAGRINVILVKDDCVIIERKHRKPQKMRVLWCPFCFLTQNRG
jgi:DNA invertase Pin-like site-specific DNA recombinase